MNSIFVHSKERLERYLLQHRDLNHYLLGDLDDFFWPYTTWYGLADDAGDLRALALLYTGTELPVLLAMNTENEPEMRVLLRRSKDLLPRRVYAHLSPGLEEELQPDYTFESHGLHYKMVLTAPEKLVDVDTLGAVVLSVADLAGVERLFARAYPGNWFDARMLETGQYVGIWAGADLVAVAGIHVYSPAYKIAALGNITVLPERRGQGLGKAVTGALCQHLLTTVDVIGLNVKCDNAAALATYVGLGFEVVGEYEEFMAQQMIG